MGYFPFYIDIKNKPCLVVGGSRVALGKVKKLLPFEPKITVVAPYICDEIKAYPQVSISERSFEDSDLDGAFMAVSATGDSVLDERIYNICGEKGILLNTVDDIEKCGFIFPAIAKADGITVAVSTEGKSPLLAAHLRKSIETLLDEKCCATADVMEKYRPVIKERFCSAEDRKAAFQALLGLCLNGTQTPDDDRINELLENLKNSYGN